MTRTNYSTSTEGDNFEGRNSFYGASPRSPFASTSSKDLDDNTRISDFHYGGWKNGNGGITTATVIRDGGSTRLGASRGPEG